MCGRFARPQDLDQVSPQPSIRRQRKGLDRGSVSHRSLRGEGGINSNFGLVIPSPDDRRTVE
jgi:hypothetical protein